MKNLPSFSIIMSTYNRSYCICNAIDSILNQYYDNFELVIIDDGSTDGTYDMISSKYKNQIKNKKIVLLKQKNTGIPQARINAIAKSKNKWITYFDSDNIMDKNYLGSYAFNIMKFPSYHCFYSKIYGIESKKMVGHEFDYNQLLKQNYIDSNAICHDRFLLDKIGSFDINTNGTEDWELMLKYSQIYAPKFIDLALVNYNDKNSTDRISLNRDNYVKNYNYITKKYSDSRKSVTAIITSYNHEKFIEKAIQSALSQDCTDFKYEIIISDDGSTDNTQKIINDIIKKNTNKNISIINCSTSKNRGLKENLKSCIEKSSGFYIALLEGDDEWTSKTKLKDQFNFLSQNEDCFMCFSKINFLEKNMFKTCVRQEKISKNKIDGYDILNADYNNPIINLSSCMFCGNILRTCPLFFSNSKVPPSELNIAFYFETFGKIGFLNKISSYYRIHDGGQWSGLSKEKQLKYEKQVLEDCLLVCKDQYKNTLKQKIDFIVEILDR